MTKREMYELENKLIVKQTEKQNELILNAFSLGASTMAEMALVNTKDKILKADNYEDLRIAALEMVDYLQEKSGKGLGLKNDYKN